MKELVAFDFNSIVLLFEDGELVGSLPYYYDENHNVYTHQPAVAFLSAVFPEAPIMHLRNETFYREAEYFSVWNDKTVLKLARKYKEVNHVSS